MIKDKKTKSYFVYKISFFYCLKIYIENLLLLICRLLVFISNVILFIIKLAKNLCNIINSFPIIICCYYYKN